MLLSKLLLLSLFGTGKSGPFGAGWLGLVDFLAQLVEHDAEVVADARIHLDQPLSLQVLASLKKEKGVSCEGPLTCMS